MNSEKLIRISIIIQLVLLLLSMIIGLFEGHHLPPLLNEYLSLKENAELSSVQSIALIFGVIALLGYFIACIGVFKFKIWSRSLYLWSNVLGLLSLPFWGITIMTPFSYLCDEGATVLIGITIAFLYFSESKEQFEKPLTSH